MNGKALETRPSLIEKLRNSDDSESWRWFFDNYSPLLFRFSRSLGLGEQDAEDLVQTTVISVSKSISEYRYQPEKCSFKSWLFMIVKRRLSDSRRSAFRRKKDQHDSIDDPDKICGSALPESNIQSPDEDLWEKDWEYFVKDQSFHMLKRKAKVEHVQVFDLAINQEMDAAEIGRSLEISRSRVHLILHRMRKLLKKERNTLIDGVR